MPKQDRFRGLHSWYNPQTDTHYVYILDKKSRNIKVSLKITDNRVQVVSGQVIK